MKKYILILLLLSLVQLFISCQKNCPSNLLGSLRFSQTDLDIIPYQGNEQRTFVTITGHQIIFNGGKRISQYGAEGGDQYVEYPKSNDYCPGNYYYTETNRIDFYGTVSGSWINFNLGMTNPFTDPVIKFFGISVTVHDSIYWVFSNGYSFDSLRLYDYTAPHDTIPVEKSIMIGPKVFYNVYVLHPSFNYHSSTVGIMETVFYSVTEGVVGFRNENGRTWYLQ